MKSDLYDLSYLEKFSGGKKDFYINILNSFVSSLDQDLASFESALLAKDWLTISELAHKLKSSFETLGIRLLRYETFLLESNTWLMALPEASRIRLSSRYLRKSLSILRQVSVQIEQQEPS
ncbi:Hpt domain-containing protein [Limibacter armeniacum]|uniref:Hpt domain-containing protein n=1 Tax=Limibacter armeniacum TaxID=466084 RepID=UPI002FE55CEB